MGEEQQDSTINSDAILEKLQEDLSQAISGWKRTAADFDNYRRRKEDEGKELITFGKETTVAQLLPVLDSLEQALKHMPQLNEELESINPPSAEVIESNKDFGKQYSNWQKGVQGIVMQLDSTLAELGVKKIEAVGKKFDPHLHEAVREEASDLADGMVLDELQSGFELNGKVMRPSQVIISSKKNE